MSRRKCVSSISSGLSIATSDNRTHNVASADSASPRCRMVRSQRDFYLCGFSLLMMLIIYRLLQLLEEVHELRVLKESKRSR